MIREDPDIQSRNIGQKGIQNKTEIFSKIIGKIGGGVKDILKERYERLDSEDVEK